MISLTLYGDLKRDKTDLNLRISKYVFHQDIPGKDIKDFGCSR